MNCSPKSSRAKKLKGNLKRERQTDRQTDKKDRENITAKALDIFDVFREADVLTESSNCN